MAKKIIQKVQSSKKQTSNGELGQTKGSNSAYDDSLCQEGTTTSIERPK